jgi:hypothetical protein
MQDQSGLWYYMLQFLKKCVFVMNCLAALIYTRSCNCKWASTLICIQPSWHGKHRHRQSKTWAQKRKRKQSKTGSWGELPARPRVAAAGDCRGVQNPSIPPRPAPPRPRRTNPQPGRTRRRSKRYEFLAVHYPKSNFSIDLCFSSRSSSPIPGRGGLQSLSDSTWLSHSSHLYKVGWGIESIKHKFSSNTSSGKNNTNR